MTIFEYIKTRATKEEIAKMFTFLENDSGYYTPNNASVLRELGNLRNYNIKDKDYEDIRMYNLVMRILDEEVIRGRDTNEYK